MYWSSTLRSRFCEQFNLNLQPGLETATITGRAYDSIQFCLLKVK